MAGNHSSGMECAEFAALISAALDNTLDEAVQAAFAAHRLACPGCQAMYAETSAGLEWLRTLKSERVEPPPRLMAAILSATSGAAVAERRERQGWWQRVFNLDFSPLLGGIRQPRFAMSVAMVFFSVSLLLNVTGVSVRDLLEVRPGTVVRAFGTAQGRVVKYYDNLRFVYEIESRVRELKRAVPEAPERERETEPRKQPRHKNDRTSMPERRRPATRSEELSLTAGLATHREPASITGERYELR
jgi:hypothetical protein